MSTAGRLRTGLRSAVRQLSVAVYVLVAYALLGRLTSSGLSALLLELALVAAGSAILAFIVEGPLLHVALVGLLVALFDLSVLLVLSDASALAATWPDLLLRALALFLTGLLTPLLVRRRRRPPP